MEDLQKETLIDSVNYDSIMSALVGESEKLEKQLTDNHGNRGADVSMGVAANDSASYDGDQLEQLITYPEKLNECLDDKTSNEELNENYQPLQVDVTSEGKGANFSVTNAVLALFPFVCGICDEKFNNLTAYFMHISMHGNISTLLHCCGQTDDGDAENSILFSCGICDIKYPTLCTLYEHLTDTEGVTDFVYRGRERTAHAYNENIENFETQKNCYGVSEGMPHAFNLDINSEINSDIAKNGTVNSLDKHYSDHLPGNSGDESDTTIINEDDIEERIKVERKYMNDIKVTERNCLKNKKRGKKKVNDNNRDKTNKSKKIRRRNSIRRTILEDTDRQTSMRGATRSADVATADVDDERNVVGEEEDIVDDYDDVIISQEDTTDTTDTNTKEIKKKRMTINRKDQLFPCEVCGAVVKHKSLHRHRLSHEERTLACDQCDNVYNCKFKLRTHKKQVHTDEKRFTCDECGKSFKAWPYLKQHRQVHIKERNILCPVCPMKFKYAAVLRVHMKTHSDQKPYSCEQCEMKFKRADLLTTHKRYHMEDKPFSCPECSKMFKVKQDMKKHFKVHLPPKFFCGICGKSFVQKYNMRTHMKVHGEFHDK